MALTAKTEKDNFSRLGQGIVGTGNTMARDLLTLYISPTDLIAKVIPRGHPCHTVWNRFNKEQQELMKKVAIDGFANFDISLVYTLLRNLCTNLCDPSKPNLPAPTQGWGKDPTPSDVTPSDDMERLRILRNAVYGHASKASISEPEYQVYWQELKNIARRMEIYLGKEYVKELNETEIYKMADAEVKQLIQMISEEKEEMKEITNKVQEQSSEMKIHATETARKQTQEIENLIEDKGRQIIKHIKGTVPDHKLRIEQLDKRLLEINDAMTKNIPLAPLEEDGDTIPVDLLYASLVITEDAKFQTSKSVYSQSRKEVSTPSDLFGIAGEEAKRIFLKGNAAHGKTTYCLWLVRKWCDAKRNFRTSVGNFDQWEKAMLNFHYVFLVQFRNANPNLSSVKDMVLNDIFGMDGGCHDSILHVLSSDKYRCLIIMDGLDEWNPSQEARKNLRCKEIPNIEGLSCGVVCLISMRTWLYPRVSRMKGDRCNVLEIQGLNESAIKIVVKNVLLNHYKLKIDSTEFKAAHTKIRKILDDTNLKSFMKIPLLAVVCVQLCCEGKTVGNSLTTFYLDMLNMLIERAYLQHESTKDISCQAISTSFPSILTTRKSIMNVSSVLLQLGKVAYEGLTPDKRKLVFQERDLCSEFGEKELKFVFDVGLISQNEARSLTSRNVSVTFFHKSMQEFLAAIYYVSQSDVIGNSIRRILSSIDIVMEWSNVIMFICGLSPSLGCTLTEHIGRLTEKDIEICSYRKSDKHLQLFQTSLNQNLRCLIKVQALFKEQTIWFTEMQACDINEKITRKEIRFHVSDIYLDCEDERTLTKYLLSVGFDEIKSLYVSDLSVFDTFFKIDTPLLMNLQNLSRIDLFWKNKDDIEIENYPFLRDMPNLRILRLSDIKFGNMRLENTPLMTSIPKLQTLELHMISIVSIRLKNYPLLTNMPNLQSLKIYASTVGRVELENTPLLTNMPSLQNLELFGFHLNDINIVNTPLLTNMPNLHTFSYECSYNPCVSNKYVVSPFLTYMENLHRLSLSNIFLCGFNIENTPQLKQISHLHSLTLSAVTVGDITLEDTALLSNMPNLTFLWLYDVKFGNIRLANSTNLPNRSTIKSFNDNASEYKSEEASLLSNMPKLTFLELGALSFGDIKLDNTPLLTNMPNLHTIRLNRLTVNSMSLRNSPLFTNMPNLRTLELSFIQFCVLKLEGTSLLTNLPRLERLTFAGFVFSNETSEDNELDHITLLSNTPNLRIVDLDYINLKMLPWLEPPKLLYLKKVILEPAVFEGWKGFIDSLTQIRHSLEIDLQNINSSLKKFICQSSCFTITKMSLKYFDICVPRYSCRYIGRHVYFGKYVNLYKPDGYCGNFISYKRGKTNGLYGRNVDRFVGKCVNSIVGRILYDLSIKTVCPMDK